MVLVLSHYSEYVLYHLLYKYTTHCLLLNSIKRFIMLFSYAIIDFYSFYMYDGAVNMSPPNEKSVQIL